MDSSDIVIMPKPDSISWETISQFLQEVFQDEVDKGIIYTLSTIPVEKYVERIKNSICFVALEDDILRGVACYEWKGRDLYLIVLGVDKNCRGKGIAKTLLLKGIEFGKERMARSLTLYTSSRSSPVRFYEALGFRKIGFESFPSTNTYSIYFHLPLSKGANPLVDRIHFFISKILCRMIKTEDGRIRKGLFPLYIFARGLYRRIR